MLCSLVLVFELGLNVSRFGYDKKLKVFVQRYAVISYVIHATKYHTYIQTLASTQKWKTFQSTQCNFSRSFSMGSVIHTTDNRGNEFEYMQTIRPMHITYFGALSLSISSYAHSMDVALRYADCVCHVCSAMVNYDIHSNPDYSVSLVTWVSLERIDRLPTPYRNPPPSPLSINLARVISAHE